MTVLFSALSYIPMISADVCRGDAAGLGADFTTAYIILGWACWVPNLLVAEWIIRRTRPARRRITTVVLMGTQEPVQADSQENSEI